MTDEPFAHAYDPSDRPGICLGCSKPEGSVFHITVENGPAIHMARQFAREVYTSDVDEDNAPVNDYGLSKTQKEAFLAGAALGFASRTTEVEELRAENGRLRAHAKSRDQRDGILQFGLVALPYFVDENRQLRTVSVARDASRWQRDGWTIINKEDEL